MGLIRRDAHHLLIGFIEPVDGYTITEFVTHGQCDARPAVIFLASEHHRPSTSSKL